MDMRKEWMVAAALLALTACGRSGPAGPGNIMVSGPGGNVTMSGTPGDITISTPNGTAEIHTNAGGGAAPAPQEGIPAYPHASTDAGSTIDLNGGSAQGHGRVIAFGTQDTPAQVVDFYAQALPAAGYTIASRLNMGPTQSLTASRGQGQGVSIVATVGGGGGTRVEIIVGANTH